MHTVDIKEPNKVLVRSVCERMNGVYFRKFSMDRGEDGFEVGKNFVIM
jgi:hypothetical protein